MRTATRSAVLLALALSALLLSCTRPADGGQASKPSVAPPSIRWAKGSAGKLRVDDGGAGGLPVLFVHGLAGSKAVWSAQLDHLRPSRRAVTLDLRGHGESDPPADGDYSLPAMASDVAAAADALGLRRFVLVGHSWGGPIIACYAALHPDRVAGILFCDAAGDLSKIPQQGRDGFMRQLEQGDTAANVRGFWEEMLKPAKAATRDLVLADFAGHPPELFKAAWRGMFDHDTAADLARISAPMMAVVTPQNQKPYSLQKLDPAIEVRQVTGTSHWVQLDDPEGFDKILDAFLAALK